MSDDWTHIWLEHKDAELTPEGRSWCDHDAWGDGAVEYIRADIAAARIAELEADNARLREEVDTLENIIRFAFDFGDELIDIKRLDSEIQEAIDSHPAVKIMAGWAGQIADALIAARQETRDE
jgi:hypothetical protein